ncbi:MAG: Kae1-associated kinase Bud32 [Promethearchaeota archaeon]
MNQERGHVIRKGAEAELIKSTWLGKPAISKIRVKKKYRHPQLDARLRKERTIMESKIIVQLMMNGIPVPTLYETILKDSCIIMEFIEGSRLKDVINGFQEDTIIPLMKEIGRNVAKMHDLGIVHGDLTTSNIIATHEEDGKSRSFTFIDFGLSQYSNSLEDIGVDIHLFKRVITATHASKFDIIYPAFLEGYREQLQQDGKRPFKQLMNKIEQIESRGRYIEKKKRK